MKKDSVMKTRLSGTTFLLLMAFVTLQPSISFCAEPEPYLQSVQAAQAHAASPAGWVADGLKTVTGPGDGNTWYGGKILVRAFTNPLYYNLTTKKNQNLYPGALWVTTGNELPAWYRDPANGVNASNISIKSAQIHGLPTSSTQQYNAIVEMLVDPSKLLRPTRDPNITAQPSALPVDPFAPKPANISQADFDAYKTWYTANITSSYRAVNPDNRYPWTQLGYTYNWGGDQSTLAGINGLSEFVILGTRSGVTSPLVTFAVYSIQSYLYKVGSDGDGAGNFHVTGSLDTLWTGTKFQPTGSSVTIAPGAVVSGGEGILVSSGGYTVVNNGTISGPTFQKYYGDGPAGTSVWFVDGGTLVNSSSGIMNGDDVAIGGTPNGQGVNVINYGLISGNSYAMRTGAGNDSLSVENGGVVKGPVSLGTGADRITFRQGSRWQALLDRSSGTASILQASEIHLQNGSTIAPVFTGTGLLPAYSSYLVAQGAVTGVFSTIVDPYPVFDFSQNTVAGGLNLNVIRVPYPNVVAPLDPGLVSVSSALQGQLAAPTPDMAMILSTIDFLPAASAVADAFRQLSPVVNAALPRFSFTSDRNRLSLLQNRSRVAPESSAPLLYAALNPGNDGDPSLLAASDSGWHGFAVAGGDWGTHDSDGSIPGFTWQGWSAMAGFEKFFSTDSVAGFALGGSQGYITGRDTAKSSSGTDSVSPVLFASVGGGPLHADVVAGYSYNRYDSRRRIVFDIFDRTASGIYNGHQISGLISAAYRFNPSSYFYIEPVTGLYVSGLFRDGYRETNAGAANLDVRGTDTWSLRTNLGPRIGLRFPTGIGEGEFGVSAFWNHEFNNQRDLLRASFSGTTAGFETGGFLDSQDSLESSVRISLSIRKELKLLVEYQLNASDSTVGNSAKIGVEWRF